ncbi:MAG TPA: hypothetical protein VGJ15_05340 [Pirellulales bacterium]
MRTDIDASTSKATVVSSKSNSISHGDAPSLANRIAALRIVIRRQPHIGAGVVAYWMNASQSSR